MNKACLVVACILIGTLACGVGADASPTDIPTLVPPTLTSTPLPTATPRPPVSVNSDCIGCPVVVPGATTLSRQSVLAAYREWPGRSKHPNNVLLVSCYRGYRVPQLGYVMGPRGPNALASGDIIMSSATVVMDEGACYAITAKYTGQKRACQERYKGSCQFGYGGSTVEMLGFRKVGESTEISGSQYNTMMQRAVDTEYEAMTQ